MMFKSRPDNKPIIGLSGSNPLESCCRDTLYDDMNETLKPNEHSQVICVDCKSIIYYLPDPKIDNRWYWGIRSLNERTNS